MARAPLLQLTDISLTFGGDPVFDGLDLVVQNGERLALVGRNGSGKSTLMKVMAGLVEPDRGERICAPGVHVGYMAQEPDFTGYATLGDFAAADLDPSESYRVEMVAEGLKFDPERAADVASGGERRRAALARLLAAEPELMLLDEPTNHLDIQAIAWLEAHLSATRTAFIVISHDRAFLRALTRATLWIDRGVIRKQTQSFDEFEAWRDKQWEEEDAQRHKLDRKIKAEARWAVEGISARRKRNMGRVRALGDLRAERANMIKREGRADMALASGGKSGKKVVEAEDVAKSFDGRLLFERVNLKIARGDRVALVGPNGAGKTTLLNMLIGTEEPTSGTIVRGSNLEIALFDQNRAQLDGDMSLWESLTGDADMRVSGKADQVMVRGQPRHVVSYLKDFLFSDAQARAPVRSLSGGERARLLLAKIMARESNFLVLDEPTNDLDIETLDLLQELLTDFDGTVLLVSHDRDFIDRVATATLAIEGDGRAILYPGGWSDYQDQRKDAAPAQAPKAAPKGQGGKAAPVAQAATSTGLSYTETHRLEELPAVMERLEAEIAKLVDYLSDPDLFTTAPLKFNKATEALIERQAVLDAAEAEWLELAERAG